ncbi:MAG TPA: DUF2330 domain-containing protein [Phycisphaerae bacterium]|nr:DUF2330 domain-containing protein [Phycisphaerae bacterium]
MNPQKHFRHAWTALAVFLVPAFALADGMYVPERAYPVLPAIPVQRALIVYHDGMETLVVESAMETDSPNVGWILPLPAEPVKLAPAEGGLLTTLAICTGPTVTHDLHAICWPAVWILGLVAPVALKAMLSKNGVTVGGVLAWILLYGLMFSIFSHAGMTSPSHSAVAVRTSRRIGNYDVAVLRTPAAAALSDWLEENAFHPLDERGLALVEDYIHRGWCFVVARLARDQGGEATPHPISATFPAAEPVYPMRLTALAGSTVHVELYVAADRMVEAPRFRCAASAMYHPLPKDEEYPFAWFQYAYPFDLAVGQTDLCDMLWDGCIVTRLQADLRPEAMNKDVELALVEFEPHWDHFYSARGRLGAAIAILLWGAVPLSFCCAVAFYRRTWPEGKWAGRFIALLAGGVLAIAAVVYIAAPVVPVGPGTRLYDIRTRQVAYETIAQAMVRSGDLHAGMSAKEMDAVPQRAVDLGLIEPDYAEGFLTNPFTGTPSRCERSPGNFATSRIGDEVYFCLYDEVGRESRVVALPLPPAGKGDTGTTE